MLFKSLFSPVTKRHIERKILLTPAHHLFRIIQDVDAYQQFLPLCTHSKVLQRHSSNQFDATLTVGLPPLFTETYTSTVTVCHKRFIVETRSIASQHFDGLNSRWQVTPQDNQCLVDFFVEMTVSDPLIVGTLDQVLEQVAAKQVQAFAERCRVIPILNDDKAEPLPARQ